MPRLIPACALFLTLPLAAQTPAAPVLGVGNFIHVAANLDKAIAFYHDIAGLDATGAPGPHNFSASDVVSNLYNAPNTQSRVVGFRIPGSEMALEIVEFQGLGAPAPAKSTQLDPGAITLTLFVRDLAPAADRMKKGGADIVRQSNTEIVARDPDGIFVRVSRPEPLPTTNAPATSNVIGAGFGVTVTDLKRSQKLYRDVLGFEFKGAVAMVPGSALPFELLEAKTGQKALHPEIHDAGAGVLRLRVRDLDSLVKPLGDAGCVAVSVGGQPVSFGRNRALIVRTPDNAFIQTLQ